MHIAYLTGTYPRATDTFIQREVTELRSQGLKIDTFSVRRPGTEHSVGTEQALEQQQTTYLLPFRLNQLLAAHIGLFLTSPFRYWRGIKLAWATGQPGLKGFLYQAAYFLEAGLLAQQVRKRQISHLHNHIANSSCTVAMLAAELGGFTFSFTIHGPHIFFEPQRWRLDKKVERAAFVVCISHFCRSQTMAFSSLEHWDKLHIVHCGIDLDLFEPVVKREPGKNLLYVGRLAVEKGLPILLECLSGLVDDHPEVRLTVVGGGADRQRLEEMTKSLGLEKLVDFVGYQSQVSVREYLQDTDVFVLPSFAEGVPVVLMEAMAMGVPVVATRIAGISELVEHGHSGQLVAPGDSTALKQAVDQLLSDPERRQKFAQAGIRIVEAQFSLKQEVSKLAQLFKQYGKADGE